jgi:hypothetical protein
MRGKYKNLRILLYFGDLLLEPIYCVYVKIGNLRGGTQETQLSLRNLATLVASFSQKKKLLWMNDSH